MDNKLSLTGSNASWIVYGLAALTVAAGVFVVVTISRLNDNAADEQAWIRLASGVQVDSQRLSKAAVEAALGNLNTFNQLETTHRQVAASMRALREGDPSTDLPSTPPEVQPEMTALNATWSVMSGNAQNIISSEALVNELSEAGAQYLVLAPNLQRLSVRVVQELVESGAPNQQVYLAGMQVALADRMHRRVNEILRSGGTAEGTAESLREEMSQFDLLQGSLRNGNPSLGVTQVVNQGALSSLAQVRNVFEETKPELEIILEASVSLEDVRLAADAIFLDSDRFFEQAGTLVDAVSALPHSRTWPSIQTTTVGLVVLVLLLTVLLGLVIISARRRADTAFRSNRRTQQAIIRLLDELSAVADGDLTTRATVSDEVTGAIADAINFAIEQLRELVQGVNRTAAAVADSAENTRQATSRLAQSANEQAGQVARATEKIQAMSTAFGTMAERSMQSSETATKSVGIAKNGAAKVRETIEGMDTIREQIQETSKRIKRLGESTQEIGDIVSLIKDIAEQTNVLALNAAIQAASAGGSGQGFAVVADEVQQLAESATNATKRISGLVQTIQLDTAEAVKSMEATTSEVVNGARLAQDAGAALTQTEQASMELSNLIQGISDEAQTYSDQAGRLSELMDGIRDVSLRTSKGTSLTADTVAELAELVLQLQASVADFKLPEDSAAEEAVMAPVSLEKKTTAEPGTSANDSAEETGDSPPWPDEDLPLSGAARDAAVRERKGSG